MAKVRTVLFWTAGVLASLAAVLVVAVLWLAIRIRVPLWIGRIATQPVPLEALAQVSEAGIGSLAEAQRRRNDLSIRIRDLERYGRALLLDGTTANGKRVMMWTE